MCNVVLLHSLHTFTAAFVILLNYFFFQCGESFGWEFNPSELELFLTIFNHSEPIRKTFCILFDEEHPKNNPTSDPIYSASIRDINLNESEPGFICIDLDGSGLKLNESN